MYTLNIGRSLGHFLECDNALTVALNLVSLSMHGEGECNKHDCMAHTL